MIFHPRTRTKIPTRKTIKNRKSGDQHNETFKRKLQEFDFTYIAHCDDVNESFSSHTRSKLSISEQINSN